MQKLLVLLRYCINYSFYFYNDLNSFLLIKPCEWKWKKSDSAVTVALLAETKSFSLKTFWVSSISFSSCCTFTGKILWCRQALKLIGDACWFSCRKPLWPSPTRIERWLCVFGYSDELKLLVPIFAQKKMWRALIFISKANISWLLVAICVPGSISWIVHQ